MPKHISVTAEDIEWLRSAYATGTPFKEMAKRLGMCVDTVKRMMMRHGIAEFEAAKYVAISTPEPQWSRPCMSCGDDTPRPKNLYLCPRCRERASLF